MIKEEIKVGNEFTKQNQPGFLFSHQRSGNHFYNDIRREHGLNLFSICHDLAESKRGLSRYTSDPRRKLFISIVRDGRDVMVAGYHYYHKFKLINGSFHDWIRGQLPNLNKDTSCWSYKMWQQDKMFKNPIQHWVDMVSGWLPKTHTIFYEDIKAAYPDWPMTGPHPRKGIIGDYKNYFTADDLKLFDDQAGDLMVDLGYYQ